MQYFLRLASNLSISAEFARKLVAAVYCVVHGTSSNSESDPSTTSVTNEAERDRHPGPSVSRRGGTPAEPLIFSTSHSRPSLVEYTLRRRCSGWIEALGPCPLTSRVHLRRIAPSRPSHHSKTVRHHCQQRFSLPTRSFAGLRHRHGKVNL